MKNIIKEFINLFANCILIICFSIASFLLLINLFHLREISRSQSIDLTQDSNYAKYRETISAVDKKMKSVNYKDSKYSNTAKPIFEYYESCSKSLKESTFIGFLDKNSITSLELYTANEEMLDEYYEKCIFNITHGIEQIEKNNKYKNSFSKVRKEIEYKQGVILDNADYLSKSLLDNSSYYFTTDISRNSIYNKQKTSLDLTIDNYDMMSSIMEDIANWYVVEFGGNR